jgi:carbon starvation protein
MIMESALALLAVICVTAGLYWVKLPDGVTEGFTYQQQMGPLGNNWIDTFGAGYGEITKVILAWGNLPATLGMLFGITMLNAFIMTTLDSATRITRYIGSELFGDTFRAGIFRNRFLMTTVVVGLAGWLALSNWKAIWPIFGASNQLIAAMVLLVATVYLMTRSRRWAFAGIPAALILLTTIAALIYQMVGFLRAKEPNYLLAAVAAILLVLACFVVVQAVRTVITVKREKARQTGG